MPVSDSFPLIFFARGPSSDFDFVFPTAESFMGTSASAFEFTSFTDVSISIGVGRSALRPSASSI